MQLLITSGLLWLVSVIGTFDWLWGWIALVLGSLVSLRFRSQFRVSAGLIWAAVCAGTALLLRQLSDWSMPNFSFHLQWLHELLRSICHGVSPDAAALVLGLTDGDDLQLSKLVQEQMRALSLTHLTAVSGTNCSILIAAVFFLLSRLGLRRVGRVVGSLLVLVSYLLLVGEQPSVWRAALMVSLVLIGSISGRKTDVTAILGISIYLLLLIQPSLAFDLGFTMSVLATVGLIELSPRLYQLLAFRLPKWLALSLAVTVSAQVFCLPVLVYLQPQQSLLAIAANLLVEPVVVIVTLLGSASVVIALVSPGLAGFGFWFASLFTQYVLAIASWLSAIDVGQFSIGNSVFTIIWITLVLVFLVVAARVPLARKFASWFLAVNLIFAFAFGLGTLLHRSAFAVANWQYTSCDVGQGDATVIRSQNQVALIDTGRDPKLINRCLSSLSITNINLLVLTHFDADHVAGLEGALKNRNVDQALVTSFTDDRPGANWIQASLSAHGLSAARAEKGMHGKLGQFTWTVLSPHHNGIDSEDPNDGSITMLWQSQQMSIFTMADLGEKGQMRVGSEI